jgi:hypothetical protein
VNFRYPYESLRPLKVRICELFGGVIEGEGRGLTKQNCGGGNVLYYIGKFPYFRMISRRWKLAVNV